MGILSSMISAGALKVEEDVPEIVITQNVGNPIEYDNSCIIINKVIHYNAYVVVSDFGKKRFDVRPLEFGYTTVDDYDTWNIVGAPEEFVTVIHKFFELWTYWLGEITKYYVQDKIKESVYNSAHNMFCNKLIKMILEYNPTGICYCGDVISVKDFVILGLIPPALNTIIPGYATIHIKSTLEQLNDGEIDCINIY